MEVDPGNVSENASEDSDSDMSEVENEESLKKLEELESQISENPYNYDAHLEIIKALRDAAELDKLRDARNRMTKYFPLAPNLWLDWLQDEIKIATCPEEKKAVQELFERAVKDYLSVEIWLEYVQFSIGFQTEGDEKGIDNIRAVFERALTAAGLHVSKGALLWEAYVEFEIVVLSMLKSKGSEEEKDQLKRIANLFRRQLSCPLFEMDETFETFNMWLVDNVGSLDTDVIDRSLVENTYKKAKEKLSKIEKFEKDLLNDISNHEDYLNHEKSKEGSPSRVLCLYERILAEKCLDTLIWKDYITYIDTVLRDTQLALDVANRSLRNCPWGGDLATMYLRLLEKSGATHEKINGVVEHILSTGLMPATAMRDVWMGYLEYMRRRYDTPEEISKEESEKRLKEMRAAFDHAIEYLNRIEGSDPERLVTQFYSRVEYKLGKNTEKARQLWSDIVADPLQRSAAIWLEYINLEMAFGDTKHLRKLFPRALQQTTDWPEIIFKTWLNFERDEGTLESFTTCLEKGTSRMAEVWKRREEIQRQEESAPQTKGRDERRAKRAQFPKTEVQKPGNRKRPLEADKEPGSPEKKQKKDNETMETGDIVDKLLSESNKDHGVVVKHDHTKDNRTIFVSNLDYTTPEEVIREIFSADGNITDLRLVKDFKGRSKGFCYVEFETTGMASKALKRDRQLIEGRPMFVSRCDPDSETRGKKFRYATGMEKNKLFIKGLPFTMTEADLRKLFEQYGAVKDVRIATFRNGHSKGIAYVDFQDEVSAAQAVLKADGMTIDEKQISVAISNPPSRQNAPASLGGGPKELGPRGKGRTQLGFLPRSVQLGGSAAKGLEKLTIDSK